MFTQFFFVKSELNYVWYQISAIFWAVVIWYKNNEWKFQVAYNRRLTHVYNR